MTIDNGGDDPAYRRLADVLRTQITRGEMEMDRPIPSVEALGERYGLTPEDVRRAVQVLRDEGLLYTLEGTGDFVSSRAEETGGG
ncbi:GntR family transcriptional regulator [Streptosporangium sp. NPDC004379]|uniref:GntR family transcriptional regulator n=1 Tax=Streptosporangium sp. NPDC004379 TaxID=3366189 RepID=UPI003678F44F